MEAQAGFGIRCKTKKVCKITEFKSDGLASQITRCQNAFVLNRGQGDQQGLMMRKNSLR